MALKFALLCRMNFENIMVSLISDYIGTGHHHQRIFRQGELIKAMKSVGFEVIRVRDQKWPMFIIVLLFALVSNDPSRHNGGTNQEYLS